MLNIATHANSPASVPLPWAHLNIPQRMRRVIDRCKNGIAEAVTEEDFAREPETAELSLDELKANIGKATILVVTGQHEPTYDRAERVRHGVSALFPAMPNRVTVIDTLKLHDFSQAEAADLAGDIVIALAERWRACGANLEYGAADLPGWAREQLARNAN